MTKSAMDSSKAANLVSEPQVFFQTQPNSEFLAQLAQFGNNLRQNSLKELSSSLQSNQALQASALVGRKVMVYCTNFYWSEGSNCNVMIEVLKAAENLTIAIYSELSELVRSIAVMPVEAGLHPLVWDGLRQDSEPALDGRYRIEACAISKGKAVALKTLITANVDSVSLGQHGEGLKLNLAGIGTVTLDEVHQITF